jgi:hypothetical protein
MKRHLLIITLAVILIITSLLITGCNGLFTVKDAGPLTSRTYEFTDFNAVDIGSSFKVDIGYSDTYSVQITTNENYFNDIVVAKSGNTLKFGEKPRWGIGDFSRTLEVKITMPELKRLKLSGATEGRVSGFQSTNDFDSQLSGASKLNLKIETGKFNSEISGASEMTATITSTDSDIRLSGSSEIMLDMATGNFVYKSSGASYASGNIEAISTSLYLSGSSNIELTGSGGDIHLSGSGASNFKLAQYYVKDVDIELSGASNANMNISGMIQGYLSGSSDLIYKGNPILSDRLDISGGSRIQHR